MPEAYIIDAVRTPRGIGKVGKGALAHMLPQHLAATVMAAIVERNGIDSKDIDDVIWSTSSQRGTQAGDMGRMAALDAGFDRTVSGVTLDRFCGGGITAISLAAGQIRAGFEHVLVAGGTEMTSVIATHQQEDQESGRRGSLGAANPRLQKKYPQSHQGVAADAIASMEGISREALDAFGAESQRRAAHAIEQGWFARSIVPVVDEEGRILLDRDEYPRPGTTAEALAALKPAFAQIADMPLDRDGTTFRKLINGVYPDLVIEARHHAGSSSGNVDGAAAVLLASDAYVAKHGLKPRAKIVASVNLGDDPTLMLNAPVPAVRKLLDRAGMTVDDIDLFEINEAFAVVAEKFIRDLGLDRDRVNVNGGAIALGHPIGATGAILIGTLVDELERRDLKRGVVTMCAAGGMAPAMIVERV